MPHVVSCCKLLYGCLTLSRSPWGLYRLILFDIDGTLINSGKAGRRALSKALCELYGVPDAFQGIDFAGKTDLQIMREGLGRLGLSPSDGHLRSLAELYLLRLRDEVSIAPGQVGVGVRDLLETIRARRHLPMGLLTGNLEQGARVKLEPFGLNPFFPFGAFGSDHEDRNQLLPIAVRRLSELRGISVGPGQCVVIGDTPLDVECARVHGSRCIAVATGPYSMEALARTDADLILSDLSATSSILEWIEGG